MVAAAVQFTQGATVGAAGQALFGVQGTAVVVSNGNNAGPVTVWTFEVVDAPPGSSIPLGIAQSGAGSTWTFTPDHTDSFLIRVTVQDGAGHSASDERNFTVKRASTRYIPSFTGEAAPHNYAGQLRGWAVAMEQWLNFLDSLVPLTGVSPAPILMTVGTATVSSATVIPANAEVSGFKIRVDTPYNTGATVAVGQTGSTALLLAAGDLDIVNASAGDVFDFSGTTLKAWGGAPHALLATVAGASSGQLTIQATYAVNQS